MACRLLACLGLFCSVLFAQDNEECLDCHGDKDMTGTKDGKEYSVFVDPKVFKASVHGRQECIACHYELEGTKFPHRKGLERVDCAECHDAEGKAHAESLHGQAAKRGDPLAPRCADCHGTHGILPHEDPQSPTAVTQIPLLCGRCHHEGTPVSKTHDIPQDRILENYSESIHGEGVFKKGLVVTAVCTSCHTSHFILPHTDPRSSINHDNVAKTCQKCHGQIERVHRKVIEGRLWEEEPHKIPACVDCHSPHKIRRVRYPAGMANQDCLSCHADRALKSADGASLFVDEGAYSVSAHSAVGCAQCHSDATVSLSRPCETVKAKVDCAVCHADQAVQYEQSTHGTRHAAGDPDAPGCLDCHGKHAILSKRLPSSPTFPRNIPDLCAQCHREGEKAAVRIHSAVADIVGSYTESIHGKGLKQSGLVVTATCTSCHTAHFELPPSDPRSTVHHDNVPDTCGTCHFGIEEQFKKSIHWPREGSDRGKLPTCKDCHTSHTISRTDQSDFRFRMMDQCGRCHHDQAETFFDTFHGKVSRLGSAGAAKCYDCHGTHNILPPSDPASTLSHAHVVDTCGKCHTGAHRQFAGYLTHATHHDKETYPWLYWAFWLMTGLLVGTLAFALFHTLAWLLRLHLSRDEWRAHKALVATAGAKKLYRRFNRFERLLHLLMIISFFTLALSGMALKFSYMKWAQVVSRLLGGFDVMGVLHRMGGITLFTVFLLHILDVAKRKRRSGKSWWRMITGPDSIVLHPRDVKEAYLSIKWFFGLGPRPRYGRWTYWEKFDYLAVFWGVAIIGATGLILWFPEFFTHVIPGWFVNVATIIHSDEALLAVGFIFTIHFFNTHFRPDKFPMDPVIFTGRVTLEELKYDKPQEYEALTSKPGWEKELVDPFPKGVERGFKVFGFIALGIGLTLIGLIVYSMIFAYR